jgi:hypothetical protein
MLVFTLNKYSGGNSHVGFGTLVVQNTSLTSKSNILIKQITLYNNKVVGETI